MLPENKKMCGTSDWRWYQLVESALGTVCKGFEKDFCRNWKSEEESKPSRSLHCCNRREYSGESWRPEETCCHSDSSKSSSINACVKYSQEKNDNDNYFVVLFFVVTSKSCLHKKTVLSFLFRLKRRLSFKDRTVRQISLALHRSHSKVLTGPRLKRTIRPCSDGCEEHGVKTAVERGHRACVMKHLISDSPTGIGEGKDDILLFQACKQPEILEMLLEFGCDVNAACPAEVEFQGQLIPAGQTALHVAAADGNLASVKILVQYGADTEPRDVNNTTPLLAACSAGHEEVTNWLFRVCLRDNNPRTKTAWLTQTLLQASFHGHLYLVGLICNKRLVSPDCSDIYDGLTPLMVASRAGHKDVIRYLLDQKVDRGKRDKLRQWSAEDYAKAYNHTECLSLLLEANKMASSSDKTKSMATSEDSKQKIMDKNSVEYAEFKSKS